MPSSIQILVKKRLFATVALSVLGMAVTAYLMYQHYKPAGTSFCNISDFFDCDIVNKSIYSEIFGIPVSGLGFLAYLAIFMVSLGVAKKWDFQRVHVWLRPGNVLKLLYWFAGISLLFSVGLTYIEFFVLYAACILCLTQQAIILAVFIVLMTVRYAAMDEAKKGGVCEFC